MNIRYNLYDVVFHVKGKWQLTLEVYDKAQPNKFLWKEIVHSEPYFEGCAGLTNMRQLYPDASLDDIHVADDTIVIIGKCYVS